MKRRTFVKQSSVAALLSASIGPNIVKAADNPGGKNPIIGTGEYRYECIHNWGQLPSTLTWQTTHGVCVDEEGLVYVKHRGDPKKAPLDMIAVFDADGKFVRSFGKEFYPGGHGIDIRKEGNEQFLYLSYVADARTGAVVKTNLKGEVIWKKIGPPEESGVYKTGSRYSPTNIAFAPDGGFYVGDGYGSNYIHQYDKDAHYVRTWGGTGVDVGKMQTPHGLWLDDRPSRKQPTLIVADRANARLQYFSLDGKHLGFVHDVLFPAHFDIRGDILLVPDLHARVSLFDGNNEAIVHLGDDLAWRKEVKRFKVRADEKLWQPGKFIHPHDACFDKDGNIFVVEWVNTGRVTKLKRVS